MEKQLAPVCAAIDVGSNTLHMVVARCSPGMLEILADELEIVRLGESVTASGEISPAKMDAAVEVLRRFRGLADELGAERVLAVATEAIRQAGNQEEFCARVLAETRLEVQLISGKEEAVLTFLGATSAGEPCAEVGVIDLGGGSLELVLTRGYRVAWHTSVPLGSGWLHDHYLSADPPRSEEIEAAEVFLQTYMHELQVSSAPVPWLITGGSANSLLLLAQRAFHLPENTSTLSREMLARCQGLLSSLPAEDITALFGQPLARAKVLLAGTLIIKHVMGHLNLQEMTVSRRGIREGLLVAYARWGEQWRAELSREIEEGSGEGEEQTKSEKRGRSREGNEKRSEKEETFAESAQRVLMERLQAMLGWSGEVRKQEDQEAVHKMRVASRRLRAALDAYQACCEPKIFTRVYRKVKKAANALGGARDADVMLHDLSAQLAELNGEERTGVQWLVTRLQKYREHQQEHLDSFLHTFEGDKLARQVKASLRERTGK